MQNIFKQLRRKLFGLDEQKADFHKAIADTNELVANLQKSLDDLCQIDEHTLFTSPQF